MSQDLAGRMRQLTGGRALARGRSAAGLSLSAGDLPAGPAGYGLSGAASEAVPVEALAKLGFQREAGIFTRRLRVDPTWGVQAGGPSPSELALLAGDLGWGAVEPEAVWLFDTETTGLAGGTGTIPFLYGWGRWRPEGIDVEQWLLADLGAERELVERALDRLATADGIVTFNGAAYDLPLLHTRAILERLDGSWRPPLHLDLLPLVRRLFGHRLDRCTLSEVERGLLGTPRHDDLPGAQVPERYRRYLRDGDAQGLAAVLVHNATDIAALAHLLGLLGRQARGQVQDPTDHLGLARFYEARGATGSARHTYATAARVSPPPLDRASARYHARFLRRQGRRAEAAEVWRRLWERWHDLEAAEALCIDAERRVGDLEMALRVSEEAIALAPPQLADRFARRIWRLDRRLARRAAARRGRSGAGSATRGAIGADPPAGEPAPWSVWLPGGTAYEAWQAARRRRHPAAGRRRPASGEDVQAAPEGRTTLCLSA